jgi:hypothetical protein
MNLLQLLHERVLQFKLLNEFYFLSLLRALYFIFDNSQHSCPPCRVALLR